MIAELILLTLFWLISIRDILTYLIPDRLIVMGTLNRLALFLFSDENAEELLRMLTTGTAIACSLFVLDLLMSKKLRRQAMGYGDIKLFFMCSLYLPLADCPVAVFLSALSGLIFMTVRKHGDDELPFAPCICLAYYLLLVLKR